MYTADFLAVAIAAKPHLAVAIAAKHIVASDNVNGNMTYCTDKHKWQSRPLFPTSSVMYTCTD